MALNGVNSWNVNSTKEIDKLKAAEKAAEAEKTEEVVDLSSDVEVGTEEEIAKDLAEAEEGLKTDETEGTEGTDAPTAPVSSSSLTPQGEQSQKVKDEMEELEKEKAENIDKMEKIEDEINALSDKAAENIAAAVAAQENAIDQNKDESKAAVDEQLQAYIAANKEGGEGMTREELQNNIKGAVPNAPALGDALSAAVEASEQLAQVDSLLGDLNGLIQDTQGIEKELECKAKEFEAAVKADEEAKKKSCDPIGFTVGEGEDAVQYDFFIDKDGDGGLSQTNEFLGADNQWSEMQAADLDQDGKVTAEELEECKIALKGSDGSVISTAEEYAAAFGEDFSIDLNSYEEGGEHSAVDPNADSDGDGVADQELLGTFNVNANGESIKGYNTLDDVDWLSENYGIEISEDTEATAQQIDTSTLSQDLKAHGDFYNFAFERNEDQKEELKDIHAKFNLTDETINDLQSTIAKEAGEKAAAFIKGLDATKEESDETVAVEGEEEVSTEPTDLGTDSTTDENPFEIDEELLVA